MCVVLTETWRADGIPINTRTGPGPGIGTRAQSSLPLKQATYVTPHRATRRKSSGVFKGISLVSRKGVGFNG